MKTLFMHFMSNNAGYTKTNMIFIFWKWEWCIQICFTVEKDPVLNDWKQGFPIGAMKIWHHSTKPQIKGSQVCSIFSFFPPVFFFFAPFLLWSCHETLDHVYTNWIAINTCDRIRGNWDIQKNCTIHGINALCTLYAWKHTDIFHTAEELLWLNKLNMVEVSLLTVFTNTENIPFVK